MLLGCMPWDLDLLPEETYQLWMRFLAAEKDAARLEAARERFYG